MDGKETNNPSITNHTSKIPEQTTTLPYINPKKEATASFASNVARFTRQTQSISPGPGSYQLARNWATAKQSTKSEDGFPRQHMWLLENKRFANERSTTGGLGPGSYNIGTKLSGGPVYAKFSQGQRFETKQAASEILGPGCYDPNISISKIGSPSRRNEAQAYLSALIPSRQHTLSKKEEKPLPGPGSYTPMTEPERKKSLTVQFNSKVPRFQQNSELDISPGMYEIESSFDKAVRMIKSPRNPVVNFIRHPMVKLVKNIEMPEPGPGSYDPESPLESSLRKKLYGGYKGDFGIHQKRFRGTKYHSSIPGPGSYNRSEREIEREQRLKQHKNSSSFASNSNRQASERSRSDVPFGNYNLRLFDISYRADKKKQHLEKLKRIDIEVPAFEVGSKR